MVGLGYGIGLPLMIFDATRLIENHFSFDYEIMHFGVLINLFGSLVVALGHVGMLALVVKSGALSWLTRRLAAVGRMALSNYLTHSIVCTTLFYGYGFNRFGQINRTGLAAIVLSIWIFQLMVSPIWLKHFRFGPAEWLWRSLTYWRLQPIRISPEETLPVTAEPRAVDDRLGELDSRVSSVMAPAHPPFAGRRRPVKSSRKGPLNSQAKSSSIVVFESAKVPRKAHELEHTVQAMTTRRTADIEIRVVGQRSALPNARATRVRLAVEVKSEDSRLAVGFGNDMVPLAVVDGGAARETGGAALTSSRASRPRSG